MESLEYYSHDPVAKRPAPGTFLFNQQEHIFLQSEQGWRVYALRQRDTKKTVAQIFFNINKKKVYSPLHAPFGSLELYGNVGQKKLEEFFSAMIADLESQGVNFCQIKNYPEAYHPVAANLVHQVLTKLHFKAIVEVSSIIPVDTKTFEKKIAASQRQKLRKCEKRFTVNQVKLTELKKIYGFISACRHERNQSLSMTITALQKVVNRFPKAFLLFQVVNDQDIAAAAIVIKVSEKILYTFYYSHDRKFNRISPVVFLISGIYRYAQEHGFTLIDLGTSMVNGGINRPLLQFKKSLGGQSSSKYIFDRRLS